MSEVFAAPWFWWAVVIAIGLPTALVCLTELHNALVRRNSYLARPVNLIRNYVLPLGALLVLLVKATEVATEATAVRIVATGFGFVVLVLLLSGLNATLFQGAPEGSWRQRVPSIFLDVARFVVIAVGIALIFAWIWGANVGGLFAALGVGSIVLGLVLQNSVGQIISGLLVLFEQPFQLGDLVATRWLPGGRVVEVNWRATHLDSGSGVYVLPNSVLATEWFINLSMPRDGRSTEVVTTFSTSDPPDRVCAVLTQVAELVPQLRADAAPEVTKGAAGEYTTTIPLRSAGEDAAARSTFLRWLWYAARRAELHLDDADDSFPDSEVSEDALTVMRQALRIGRTDQEVLLPHIRIVRYGTGETLQFAGEAPTQMMFVVSGRVRLTATTDKDVTVGIRTLERGDYLGQTTLTREPVIAAARALDEVLVVQVDREHIEALVLRNPSLLQEISRAIEERKATVQTALAPAGE
ncbi:mechanosensitive ion channel family protein [Mycolicibacterium sp. 050232]|uniref:mechanosensitive ion channel family protein n=1 Tax=Mycolicibacterium sp. 050232 TaxID=3113982 RepID=UPI002E2C45DD|nr:mechanosensitive ion channel family protein [Mycolicibacterium sp. 050232]MED5814772.1 mechanosensitive ion channel family protein [Mycolicibacterium sp. 050232]